MHIQTSKKHLLSLSLLVTLIISANLQQVADAKWYNPLSWFKSSTKQTTESVQPKTPSPSPSSSSLPPLQESVNKPLNGAKLTTEKGVIIISFYEEQAPITVKNFKKLVGDKFYNVTGMKFHRVVEGFVVQTGDPTGTGYGGSSETIPLEAKNKLSHDSIGVVAMARGPLPNSASSQFYITLAEQKTLDGKYAIFAEVIQGLDVVSSIRKHDRMYGVELMNVDAVPHENRKKWGQTK